MAAHNELGLKGEELAVIHLKGLGYQILERNWRFGKEEIDVIALHDDFVVVVEVKTRNTDFFGPPEQSVSRSKQGHLVRAANAYVQKLDIDCEVRFDVIGIVLNKQGQTLRHVEHAFQPHW